MAARRALSVRLPSLSSRLPRPTRTTFVILVAGAAMIAVTGVAFTHERTARQEATTELAQAEAQLAVQRSELAEYRRGTALTGADLAARVGPSETLLPDRRSSPVPAFSDIEESARRFGLTPSGLSTTLAYTAVPAADAGAYPGLWQATGSLRVSGPIEGILAWLRNLEAYPQSLTYTTGGLSTSGAAPTLDVTMRLWAVDDPEWRAGRPVPETTPTSTPPNSTPPSSTPASSTTSNSGMSTSTTPTTATLPG